MYPSQRISAMEKGQCPTVATWESGNVRSRKTTPTATTPGQVIVQAFTITPYSPLLICPSIPCTSKTSLQGNGGPPRSGRRQSLLSVAWTDIDTGVEKIMWREIDKVSRVVFPALFLVFVVLYWPILLMKSSSF